MKLVGKDFYLPGNVHVRYSVKGVEGLVRRAGRNQFIYRLSGLVRTRPGGAENRQRYFTMVFLYYVVHWYRGLEEHLINYHGY